MKPAVIDASVAVKWFLPEIHYESARKILKLKHDLIAPDIIWAEFGNALLKKVRMEELSVQEAADILKDFIRYPIEPVSSKNILNVAWQNAYAARNSVYDNLYLALAISRDCDMMTADRKFYDAMRKNTHFSRVIWVENIIK